MSFHFLQRKDRIYVAVGSFGHNVPPRNHRRNRVFLLIAVLGLFAAGLFYLVLPLQYEAQASIQIHSAKPTFLGKNTLSDEYERFVQTHLAYLRSPMVINKVLEDPDVAKLPIVIKERDKRAWLTQKLCIEPVGKSEVINISIKTDTEDASEKIVNAVVDAYFTFIEEVSRQTDTSMLVQLQIEKRRQQTLATALQESILAQTEKDEDASYDREQLARTNKTIEQIDDRILAIQVEARAPGRIIQLSRAVPSAPKRW